MKPWSVWEDARLIESCRINGDKWSIIAAGLSGREPIECMKRCNELASFNKLLFHSVQNTQNNNIKQKAVHKTRKLSPMTSASKPKKQAEARKRRKLVSREPAILKENLNLNNKKTPHQRITQPNGALTPLGLVRNLQEAAVFDHRKTPTTLSKSVQPSRMAFTSPPDVFALTSQPEHPESTADDDCAHDQKENDLQIMTFHTDPTHHSLDQVDLNRLLEDLCHENREQLNQSLQSSHNNPQFKSENFMDFLKTQQQASSDIFFMDNALDQKPIDSVEEKDLFRFELEQLWHEHASLLTPEERSMLAPVSQSGSNLFEADQLRELRTQIQQNFQLMTQSYAIQREIHGNLHPECLWWEQKLREVSAVDYCSRILGAGPSSFFAVDGAQLVPDIFQLSEFKSDPERAKQFKQAYSQQIKQHEKKKQEKNTLQDEQYQQFLMSLNSRKQDRKKMLLRVVTWPESMEKLTLMFRDSWDPALFPRIVPVKRNLNNQFSDHEDHLVFLGVRMFGFDDPKSIRAFCLPNRRHAQITLRLKALIARNAKENPTKTLYLMPFKPMTVFEKYVLTAVCSFYHIFYRKGASLCGPLFKEAAVQIFDHYPKTIIKTTWNRLNLQGEIPFPWDTPITGEEWFSWLLDAKATNGLHRPIPVKQPVPIQVPRTKTLSRKPFKEIKPKSERQPILPRPQPLINHVPIIPPQINMQPQPHVVHTVGGGPTRIGRGKMYVPNKKSFKALNHLIAPEIHSEPNPHDKYSQMPFSHRHRPFNLQSEDPQLAMASSPALPTATQPHHDLDLSSVFDMFCSDMGASPRGPAMTQSLVKEEQDVFADIFTSPTRSDNAKENVVQEATSLDDVYSFFDSMKTPLSSKKQVAIPAPTPEKDSPDLEWLLSSPSARAYHNKSVHSTTKRKTHSSGRGNLAHILSLEQSRPMSDGHVDEALYNTTKTRKLFE